MQIAPSRNCQGYWHHQVICWDQIGHRECGQELCHLGPSVQDSGPRGLAQVCHGSTGTPLGTHAGTEALGLEDARTAIRT
jgi:hypothetical protein